MSIVSKNDFFLLSEVVKKNFSSKYKDSALGILWSVLQPLLIMIVMTIVFSTMFSRSIDNYPVYLLAGKSIYDFYSAACNVSLISIKSNKNILLKTAAPKHIFLIGGIISEFFNFIITIILLIGVMIVTKAPFYLNIMPLSIIPIISAIFLVTGVGSVLSICQVYYSDTRYLWRVLSQLIFYSSAIFYPMETIPEPYHQFLILNPVFWLVNQFRSFYIYGTIPELIYIVDLVLLSIIIFVFGVIVYKKYSPKISMKF